MHPPQPTPNRGTKWGRLSDCFKLAGPWGNLGGGFPSIRAFFCHLVCDVIWQNLKPRRLGFNLHSSGYTNIPRSPNLLGSWFRYKEPRETVWKVSWEKERLPVVRTFWVPGRSSDIESMPASSWKNHPSPFGSWGWTGRAHSRGLQIADSSTTNDLNKASVSNVFIVTCLIPLVLSKYLFCQLSHSTPNSMDVSLRSFWTSNPFPNPRAVNASETVNMSPAARRCQGLTWNSCSLFFMYKHTPGEKRKKGAPEFFNFAFDFWHGQLILYSLSLSLSPPILAWLGRKNSPGWPNILHWP